MDDKAFERFKTELQESYSKDREAGVPGLLENVDWLPNGMTVREADAVAVELQGMRRVAVGWGVMTPLLGDAQNMTYDNLKTSVVALLKLTALPLLEWFQEELTGAYMGMYAPEGAFLGYDADGIEELQEDTGALYTRAREAAGRPILTVNEARGMAKWERVENPEADVLWAPINVVPADGAPPEAGLPPETDAEKALKAAGDGHDRDLDALVLQLTTP